MYGYSRHEAIGKKKEALLRTSVLGSSFEDLQRSLLENETWSGELLHHTKDGRVLTVESQIELVLIGKRRLVFESTRDITERKKWEQRRQLLLGELSHRVSNILAVVQSMARQMLRTAKSSDDFVELFEGRLGALARSHSLLVEAHWEGAELGYLARNQLAAYMTSERRLRLEGEPVTLPTEFATPLGLVFHELATNAAKYGAFSVANGSVLLSWRLEQTNGDRWLHVTWRESGGPAITAPKKKGFGGTLIERGLPGASVRREFTKGGLVCTIEIELPKDPENGTQD